ncbi:1-aminocyclopropane-1-carboxylate oxidase-like [Amblyraja radiata]|uniref:1-aminocyclopropane-1-carboxylate oxidase-like n=1 Tax=Amblyraja radiata TaxID=386614 RepID=UPI001401F7F2|nr:1-aminocyclopropane-1-carboxylate oxidase-like [Amblyraja radiata]
MSVAVVDFGSFALGQAVPSAHEMKRLSTEIEQAFSQLGFVYLKNTGIKDEQVFEAMDICRKFFLLPKDIKQQYARSKDSDIPCHGWIDFQTESLNPTELNDLKEAFNVTSLSSTDVRSQNSH